MVYGWELKEEWRMWKKAPTHIYTVSEQEKNRKRNKNGWWWWNGGERS